MLIDVVATLTHAIQPPLTFHLDIDVIAVGVDRLLAYFTIHLSVISSLSLEARSGSTPRIAPISSWPHKPHNLPQVLLGLFAHQEGVPTFFPPKIPAKLGWLTAPISHRSAKKPPLVTF
jgi:hypothetical protein